MKNIEIIEQLLGEIAFGSREYKIDMILNFAGDEINETSELIELAKKDDKQLNQMLLDFILYELNS